MKSLRGESTRSTMKELAVSDEIRGGEKGEESVLDCNRYRSLNLVERFEVCNSSRNLLQTKPK